MYEVYFGCFILRATRLSNKLLEQGYVNERLESSLKKFYGRYGDLVLLSRMLKGILYDQYVKLSNVSGRKNALVFAIFHTVALVYLHVFT